MKEALDAMNKINDELGKLNKKLGELNSKAGAAHSVVELKAAKDQMKLFRQIQERLEANMKFIMAGYQAVAARGTIDTRTH